MSETVANDQTFGPNTEPKRSKPSTDAISGQTHYEVEDPNINLGSFTEDFGNVDDGHNDLDSNGDRGTTWDDIDNSAFGYNYANDEEFTLPRRQTSVISKNTADNFLISGTPCTHRYPSDNITDLQVPISTSATADIKVNKGRELCATLEKGGPEAAQLCEEFYKFISTLQPSELRDLRIVQGENEMYHQPTLPSSAEDEQAESHSDIASDGISQKERDLDESMDSGHRAQDVTSDTHLANGYLEQQEIDGNSDAINVFGSQTDVRNDSNPDLLAMAVGSSIGHQEESVSPVPSTSSSGPTAGQPSNDNSITLHTQNLYVFIVNTPKEEVKRRPGRPKLDMSEEEKKAWIRKQNAAAQKKRRAHLKCGIPNKRKNARSDKDQNEMDQS